MINIGKRRTKIGDGEQVMVDLIDRQAEPSYEAVMSYCKKRNLALIDCGELHNLEYEAWTQKPKRQKGLWVVETEADIKSGTNAISGYKCNICGYFVPWDFTHKSPFFIEEYNFCPHCGARMEEKLE